MNQANPTTLEEARHRLIQTAIHHAFNEINIALHEREGKEITKLAKPLTKLIQIAPPHLAEKAITTLTQLYAAAKEDSRNDPLTGLENRKGLENAYGIKEALQEREGGAMALIMIDLDHFKALNDTYGHDAGDEALTTIACAMTDTFRDEDTIVRLGGDEFCILFYNPEPDHDFKLELEKATALFESLSFTYNGTEISLRASVGLEVFEQTERFSSAFTRADKTMYDIKKAGKNPLANCETLDHAGFILPDTGTDKDKQTPMLDTLKFEIIQNPTGFPTPIALPNVS